MFSSRIVELKLLPLRCCKSSFNALTLPYDDVKQNKWCKTSIQAYSAILNLSTQMYSMGPLHELGEL